MLELLPSKSDEVLFAWAKSQYTTAQFSQALKGFRQLADQALQEQNWNSYVEISLYLIRICLEQERREELMQLAFRVQDLLTNKKNLSPSVQSKAHYTLGILRYFLPQEILSAKDQFDLAVEIALAGKDFEALAYALYGRANVYFELDEYTTCLAELEKLETILENVSLPDLRTVTLILRGFIDRNRGNFQNALRSLEAACQALKHHPNIYIYLQALYGLGSTYLEQKETEKAQVVLELAKLSCPESELPRMYKQIMKSFNKLRTEMAAQEGYEIEFDTHAGSVSRRGVGSISLQSQFVLRDLLTVFLENPDKTFSKEELVQKIWGEEYSPLVHDNKVYVTLKRLRQSLQPVFPDVEAVLRVRNGYCLNRILAVRLQKEEK